MVLGGSVGVVRLRADVMRPRVVMVRTSVVICIVGVGIVVVVVLLRALALAVLLVLHATILKPDLHLALRQIQITRQFPSLLLRHVGVEQELFLQLQGLEFRVGFALFPHRHLTGPLQRICTGDAGTHTPDRQTATDAQGTCGEQRRWGGTPHHLTQLVGLFYH